MNTYNSCDGGHETQHEVRRLPISEDSAVLVCRSHYNKEMAFRRDRQRETQVAWDFPTWESLRIVEPAIQ
jgi:hypothetical protein